MFVVHKPKNDNKKVGYISYTSTHYFKTVGYYPVDPECENLGILDHRIGWRPDLIGESGSPWVIAIICDCLFLRPIPAGIKRFGEHSGQIIT